MLKLDLLALNSSAIVLEAMPFLLIGSLLGAIIEVFAPEDAFRGNLFRHPVLAIPATLFLGFILPTCECGVIPIAKRLARKGLPEHLSVMFMMAAPVVNPVVIAATWVAFRDNFGMTAGRIGISLAIAVITGLVLSRLGGIYKSMPSDKDGQNDCADADEPGHSHNGHCECGHEHSLEGESLLGKWRHVAIHGSEDFLAMLRFLVIGALFAAAFRVYVPKSVSLYFQPNLLPSILFMMALAVLLSICSEADAFVAASFTRFSPFSQLAFVTLGPVLDLKLILMYAGTFKKRAVLTIAISSIAVILVSTLTLGLLLR
jgi:hypothetical protein